MKKLFHGRIHSMLFRRRLDMNDDLAIVRTVFHINMSICLLIAQFLFLLGIDHVQYAVRTDSLRISLRLLLPTV